MPASINDKLKKYKSLFSTTLSTGIGTGTSDTITPATVTGLPTDTAITLTIDRVDASGTATPSKMERIKGVVSSGNIINYVRAVDGTTEQAHTAGAVVEMVWNADDWNDLVDWGLVEHGQDGKHSSALVTTLKATGAVVNTGTSDDTIVTPKALADSDYAKTTDITVTEDSTNTFTNKTLSTGSKLDANADSNFTFNSLSRQAIINGNFDVWQRGTSFDLTTDYKADRWKISSTTAQPVGTATRQTFTVGQTDVPNNPTYFYRTTVTDVNGATEIRVRQRIENVALFSGGKATLSFWAKSDAASGDDIDTEIYQYFGSGGSAAVATSGQTHALTTSWQKFTETFNVPSISGKTVGDNNYIMVDFYFPIDTFVIDIAQVQLCAGDVALPFMPKSYEEELRACMRYCYIFGGNATYQRIGVGVAYDTTHVQIHIVFPVSMRIKPTLSISNLAHWELTDTVSVWGETSAISLVTDSTSLTTGRLDCTTTGLTQYRFYYMESKNTLNARLIFESEL